MAPPEACTVTGVRVDLTFHGEDYDQPWDPIPVSRRAHFFIHTRFRNPARWWRFLEEEALVSSWARTVSCEAIPERGWTAEAHITVLMAMAPRTSDVSIPWHQLYV